MHKTNHNIIFRLFVLGILMYGSGFLLWNLGNHSAIWQRRTKFCTVFCKSLFLSSENEFCHHVEAVRSYLPPLLSPVTQLHGWWHLFAGELSELHNFSAVLFAAVLLIKVFSSSHFPALLSTSFPAHYSTCLSAHPLFCHPAHPFC